MTKDDFIDELYNLAANIPDVVEFDAAQDRRDKLKKAAVVGGAVTAGAGGLAFAEGVRINRKDAEFWGRRDAHNSLGNRGVSPSKRANLKYAQEEIADTVAARKSAVTKASFKNPIATATRGAVFGGPRLGPDGMPLSTALHLIGTSAVDGTLHKVSGGRIGEQGFMGPTGPATKGLMHAVDRSEQPFDKILTNKVRRTFKSARKW